jgi:hypothetical protein
MSEPAIVTLCMHFLTYLYVSIYFTSSMVAFYYRIHTFDHNLKGALQITRSGQRHSSGG